MNSMRRWWIPRRGEVRKTYIGHSTWPVKLPDPKVMLMNWHQRPRKKFKMLQGSLTLVQETATSPALGPLEDTYQSMSRRFGDKLPWECCLVPAPSCSSNTYFPYPGSTVKTFNISFYTFVQTHQQIHTNLWLMIACHLPDSHFQFMWNTQATLSVCDGKAKPFSFNLDS